jgi:hypothetical protein
MFLDTVQPLLRTRFEAGKFLAGGCRTTLPSHIEDAAESDQSMEQQIILPVLMGAEYGTVIDPRTADGVHHGNCNAQSLGTRDRK